MIRATHSLYVLDASVAAKWFTRHVEPERDRALALRQMHVTGRCKLALPEFAILEILNAVRFSRRADAEDLSRALASLEKLRLETYPLQWDLLHKASAIAWTYGIALYDAAYVALAETLGHPLLTADEVLVKRMKGHAVVVRLGELDLP